MKMDRIIAMLVLILGVATSGFSIDWDSWILDRNWISGDSVARVEIPIVECYTNYLEDFSYETFAMLGDGVAIFEGFFYYSGERVKLEVVYGLDDDPMQITTIGCAIDGVRSSDDHYVIVLYETLLDDMKAEYLKSIIGGK